MSFALIIKGVLTGGESVALPFLFVTITNIAYVGLAPTENNRPAR
jgi:hypothetical protein